MPNSPQFLILNPADDVMIALRELPKDALVNSIPLLDAIPSGHKAALRPVRQGAPVRRYGQVIGFATRDIAAGQHVHVHNLAIGEFEKDYRYSEDYAPTRFVETPDTFMGIVRPDGRVATRNYIGILTSVNCSATVARAIADRFRREIRPEALEPYPNVDGVVALTHGFGCAIDAAGEGLRIMQRTIAGYVRHPNFAGLLVIGLGCETNQISAMMKAQALEEGHNLQTFNIQDAGGTPKSIAKGVEIIQGMLAQANRVERTPVPVSHLKIGLQCGGSDSYSGITANPVLGAAMDILVRNGGTAILSETPEIYGAEHLLTCRAASPAIGRKLVDVIDWWKDLCERNHASLDNNPSAGNKAGGLTTVLEKSLGGVAKGGTTGMMEVYQYAEPVEARGLVFMNTPGYDPMSATGQVAGGANMICFTTGRGSAFGCAPAPSLKLATNTALWNRQQDDMDFNCGTVVDQGADIRQLGREFYDMMLRCASGEPSKSELYGYGQNEFVPWQPSVIT
ncbi:Altronate hydrolase [Castellaniella defragrans 65Phen]|jgi:altronate hydrolase|uniref:Altronate hydrolase n=1 Tax=Castellaniella defragrans (strain DSM 12143 / CCUG 39792 / 65Phen) TaxID=1437824 RepID=W8X555_CASD6|nr:altronate dehydratase family protein [Castellaniella defragrans]CDM25327.1 Altronate hydrolase [Castellaniella defragrans 65Phen]